MSKDQKPKDSKSAGPGGGKGISTPESEATARINSLQKTLTTLKQELHTIQGKLANRDPGLVQRLIKENEQLKSRITVLRKALYAIMVDADKPRQMEEADLKLEVLRRAAIEFFKKENVAPEIWKNIES